MAAVLAGASYYRIGFSHFLAVRARRVRVPGGSVFHLEPEKYLDCLVGKLRSMHLAVPGAVAYLYHIQRALSHGGGGPSLAISAILLQDRGLADTISVNGSPSHTSSQDCPPRDHPSRVIRRLGNRGRGRVDRTRQVCTQFGMASPMATVHHRQFSLPTPILS